MIGQTIGSYRVVRMLGGGGMGDVYLAQHEVIGRLAAIKLVRREYAANQDILARMFNEARITALIKHPGLVDVYDFGRLPDGSAYIVMEYLEGETLAARLHREKRLTVEIAVALARQIAIAVGAAHQKGIVHRDLKPENVFLVHDDELASGVRARILDFGIAKLSGDLFGESLRTRTGSILGTPVYMSPEQCRGAGTVDWRSDIYSLGCILFEMVTGEHLFHAEGMGEVLAAHLHTPARRPSSVVRGLPSWLDDTILRMLAKNPLERPQSMDEVALALGGRPRSLPGVVTDPMAARATPLTTTHNQSTGEVSRPYATVQPKSRRGLYASMAALAAAALATGLYLSTRDHAPAAIAATPTAPAPAPAPDPAPPVPAPVPVPVPDPAPPAPAPAPDPAPRTVTLTINSDPPGATVFTRSGSRLGTTPLVHTTAPSSEPLLLDLRLDGHATARLRLVPDEDRTSNTTLKKRAARGTRPAAGETETLDPFAQ